MTVNGVSGELKSSDLTPPDPITGKFSFSPTFNGQPFTISGTILSPLPIDNWHASSIPGGIPGFSTAGLITFDVGAADPAISFSVTDINGQLVSFTDRTINTPESASNT